MKRFLFVGLSALSVAVVGAAPEVSNVVMTQDANRNVVVTYDLAGEDAIVTLSVETNGVPLAEGEVANLSGDVNKVIAVGTGKRIVWEATRSWPNHKVDNARARVTAWSKSAPPRYVVFDMTRGMAATEANPWPMTFYTSAETVPGGITNRRYKTTHLILRRVDPTDDLGFVMGSHSSEEGYDSTLEMRHNVRITKPYYLGVYEFTEGQRNLLNGDAISTGSAYPATGISWQLLHGNCVLTWPYNASEDTANETQAKFLINLRNYSGGFLFDLPTDAQWEYACRAGTTGAFNDGTEFPESTERDSRLDGLGLYKGNLGDRTGPAEVGSFKPNAWGFYDMHGNVREWVFDRRGPMTNADAVDPYESNGTQGAWERVVRGGSWGDEAQYCRSGSRTLAIYIDYSEAANGLTEARKPYVGFRIAARVEVP